MKTTLILKKANGAEKANQDVYNRFENFFSHELKTNINLSKANANMFIVSEIVDNIFRYESQYFSYVKVEAEKHDDGKVEIEIQHDGREFDPFLGASPTKKIQAAIKKLGCSSGPICDTYPKNSAGEYVALTYGYNFAQLTNTAPYSFNVSSDKDSVKIQFIGKVVRGWGIETDDNLIKALESIKKDSASKIVTFDLTEVSFWDTKGSSIILSAALEINNKHNKRAKIVGDHELIDYVPHYQKEIDEKKIIWD